MASRTLPEDKLKLARAEGILGKFSPNGPNNKLDWMGSLEDSTCLSRISIPGTHDAAAWNYKGEDHQFWNCQSMPLLEQLDLGVRALDLRFGWAKDGAQGSARRLLFFHSVACLDEKAQLEDVLWGLFNWLNQHPTETLLISLKRDDAPDDYDGDIQKRITDLMDGDETRDYWFQTPNSIPTLGDVRGKIVLLNRMVFKEERGIKLTDGWERNGKKFEIIFNKDSANPQTAYIEDYFLMQNHPKDAVYQIGEKEKVTTAHLAAAKEGKSNELWITFSSAVGDKTDVSEDVIPKDMAIGRDNIIGINGRLVTWFQNDKGPDAAIGIVFMDFVGSDPKLIEGFLPPNFSP